MQQDKRVMLVYGTRPEAIKMAPVVRELENAPWLSPLVVVTGQHQSMLDQVHQDFGIRADHNLEIMRPGQTLSEITTRSLQGVQDVLAAERPDVVVVQGDTTSALSAALAAFYAQVPVVHLEAGLRTNDPYSPYPEEMNRRLTGQLTSLHLAPTPLSRDNLLREGISPSSIVTTGNTVIDALLWTVKQNRPFSDPRLTAIEDSGKPVLLCTAHRRESWGAPMQRVGEALVEIARRFPEVEIVLPAHRNPVVRETLLPLLQRSESIHVLDPLPYADFARLMALSTLVLTDSGGVQEEAPSLGKPVLVMRESTERPEGIEAGTARLVGTSVKVIVETVECLLRDKVAYWRVAQAINPYGDGAAAERSVKAIQHLFGFQARPHDFAPTGPADTAQGILATASAVGS